MKTNINKAINEANISIHNVNQLFSFGDFICFGDFILLWATLFSRRERSNYQWNDKINTKY